MMNIDDLSKAMKTKPDSKDTGRTVGWKQLVEDAKTLHKEGNLEEAAEIFEQSIVMAELRLGTESLVLAHILMQYSELCKDSGNSEKARALTSRAREMMSNLAAQVDPAGDAE